MRTSCVSTRICSRVMTITAELKRHTDTPPHPWGQVGPLLKLRIGRIPCLLRVSLAHGVSVAAPSAPVEAAGHPGQHLHLLLPQSATPSNHHQIKCHQAFHHCHGEHATQNDLMFFPDLFNSCCHRATALATAGSPTPALHLCCCCCTM